MASNSLSENVQDGECWNTASRAAASGPRERLQEMFVSYWSEIIG